MRNENKDKKYDSVKMMREIKETENLEKIREKYGINSKEKIAAWTLQLID